MSESGGVRLPIPPYLPLLHNNSGSDAGYGNITPDQVRDDRETPEHVSDELLVYRKRWCPSLLVWTVV